MSVLDSAYDNTAHYYNSEDSGHDCPAVCPLFWSPGSETISSPTISRNHLNIWLKANHSVNQSNDDILKQCFNDNSFMQLFGGYKALMFDLIQRIHSNQDKLESIHELISTNKRNYIQSNTDQQVAKSDNKSKIVNKATIKDVSDPRKTHINAHKQEKKAMDMKVKEILWLRVQSNDNLGDIEYYFWNRITNETSWNEPKFWKDYEAISLFSISYECISHICGYLNKRDIFWFKLTSREIAILCLQEMEKISIGLSLFQFDPRGLSIKYCRYNPNKQLISLYDEWSTQCNIPRQNQLLFIDNDRIRYGRWANFNQFTSCFSLFDYSSNKMKTLRVQLERIGHDSFLIVDSRKCVVLDDKTVRKFDIAQDTYCNLFSYKLMIFQYQSVAEDNGTADVEYILFDGKKVTYHMILEYIENRFMSVHNDGNNWYCELKQNLNRMQCFSQHSKLSLCYFRNDNLYGKSYWRHIAQRRLSKRIYDGYHFVCQINSRHPDYFNTTDGKTVEVRLRSMQFSTKDIQRAIKMYQTEYKPHKDHYNYSTVAADLIAIIEEEQLTQFLNV